MIAILFKYWRPIITAAVILVIAAWLRVEWVSYGSAQYNAGYAAAVSAQKAADEAISQQREQDKQRNEKEAQQRIDKANSDARAAANNAGRLQQQITNIRKQLRDYSSVIGAGEAVGKTGDMLAYVLQQSIERNVELANYADAAREAGMTCEIQYDSLRNKKAP